MCFCQAETRAEFAERTVAKLEKSIDDLEGMRAVTLTMCRMTGFNLAASHLYPQDAGNVFVDEPQADSLAEFSCRSGANAPPNPSYCAHIYTITFKLDVDPRRSVLFQQHWKHFLWKRKSSPARCMETP